MNEPTPRSLAQLSPQLPEGVRFKLVGAGGTGGIVARYGLMFAAFLANSQHCNASWSIIDGDDFEDSNRSRMFFSHDGNKAAVLCDDLIDLVVESPVTLTAVEEFVTKDNMPRLFHNGDIILLTVDNHATRKLVSNYCEHELDEFALFSCGNDGVEEDASGRPLRGTYGNCQIYLKGRYDSPSLTRFHPEIANPVDKLPTDTKHCTEIIASTPQILFANLAAASSLLNALWLYLCDHLHYSELAFDIADGKMQPLAIPAPKARKVAVASNHYS
ncbi:MAG TPA: ThiF family adenylyltransferase [Pirellulaceae bacterium]|nr:ThiF family adenylyltransferase [Pirellulaceae bacterium]